MRLVYHIKILNQENYKKIIEKYLYLDINIAKNNFKVFKKDKWQNT